MNDALIIEQQIARDCISLWGETPQNHVCGLIEEAMEAVAITGALTEEQAISVATAAIKRAYKQTVILRSASLPTRQHMVNGELTDLVVMACVVREDFGNTSGMTGAFYQTGYVKIADIVQKHPQEHHRKALWHKLSIKKEEGVRL